MDIRDVDPLFLRETQTYCDFSSHLGLSAPIQLPNILVRKSFMLQSRYVTDFASRLLEQIAPHPTNSPSCF